MSQELNFYGYVPGLIIDALASGVVIPRGTPIKIVSRASFGHNFDLRIACHQINRDLYQRRGMLNSYELASVKEGYRFGAAETCAITQKAAAVEVAYLFNGAFAAPEMIEKVYDEGERLLMEKVGMLYAIANPLIGFEQGDAYVFIDVNDLPEITSGKARIVGRSDEKPIWEEYAERRAEAEQAYKIKVTPQMYDPFTKTAFVGNPQQSSLSTHVQDALNYLKAAEQEIFEQQVIGQTKAPSRRKRIQR